MALTKEEKEELEILDNPEIPETEYLNPADEKNYEKAK